MAVKNKIKLTFEPIIIFILTIITIAVYILQKTLPKLNLEQIFVTSTSIKGTLPFNFKEALSYVRIFIHIFGTPEISSWFYLAILFFITPQVEEKYGTLLLLLMMILSIIFTGALCSCFCKTPVSGINCIFCLILSLRIIDSFRSKELPLYIFLLTGLFIFAELTMTGEKNYIPLLINIASGICGSLISLLTGKKKAKKTTVKKQKKEKTVDVIEELEPAYFDNEADSPRFKSKNKKTVVSYDDDETTVIGTLEF